MALYISNDYKYNKCQEITVINNLIITLLEKCPYFYGKILAAEFPDSFFFVRKFTEIEIYGKVPVKCTKFRK